MANHPARSLLGQGATEYLVLLAVVLIIALVAIALLGFFPGLSNDAKYTQNRAYWESQSPIAIVDGVAADEASFLPTPGSADGQDAFLITLKNNGGDAVELIYVSFGGYSEPLEFSTGYSDTTSIGAPILLTPLTPLAEYSAYVGAPRGSGFGTNTAPIILQPGETVTIGGGLFGAGDPAIASDSSYSVQVCRKSNEASVGKMFDSKNFVIAYGVISDGGFKTFKYQKGELMLRCIPDLGV
jgi:hypothetical protein